MWRFLWMTGIILTLSGLVRAEPAELLRPAGAGMSAPLSDEARLERRERMHRLREILRAQQQSQPVPMHEASAVAPSLEPGLRRRHGEQLRRLPPEERRRLRQQMREAARNLYQK